MNGRVAALLAVIITNAAPAAASAVSQELRLGVTGGVSSATLDGTGDLRRHTGFMLGVSVSRELSDHLALETGLTWIDKGAVGLVPGFEEALRARHEISYLSIPLVLRGSPPIGGRLRPVALAGPFVAFEVDCDSDLDAGLRYLAVVPCGLDSDRAKVDWGLIVGGGVSTLVGPWSILLEARYHLGLTDLRPSLPAVDVYNRAFTLGAAVSVPLQRGDPGRPAP